MKNTVYLSFYPITEFSERADNLSLMSGSATGVSDDRTGVSGSPTGVSDRPTGVFATEKIIN